MTSLKISQVEFRKGWCPRTGKGQRFMGMLVVNGCNILKIFCTWDS